MRWKFLVFVLCFTALLGVVSAADCPTSMVSYWKFDDAPGSSTADEPINNNDGSVTGAGFNPVDKKVGSALNLDGDDYVQVSHDSSLTPDTPGDDLTIELWFKPTQLLPVTKTLVNKQGYKIYLDSSHEIKADIGGTTFNSGVTAVVDGTWYFVAVTWDEGSSDFQLYINNVAQVTDSLGSITYGTDDLFIGSSDGSGDFFIGLIDELAISNTVRDVGADYTASNGGSHYCDTPTIPSGGYGVSSDANTEFSTTGSNGICINSGGTWRVYETDGGLSDYNTLQIPGKCIGNDGVAGMNLDGTSDDCCPKDHVCTGESADEAICVKVDFCKDKTICSHYTTQENCTENVCKFAKTEGGYTGELSDSCYKLSTTKMHDSSR